VLTSDDLRIRLIRDRGQLRAEFQRTSEDGDRWHSIDIVRRLLTGEGPQSGAALP
jgi:hypothetical protein